MAEAPNKKQILAEIKKFKSTKDYDSMLVTAQNAVQAFPDDNKLKKLLNYAQVHYVSQKLHSDVVKQLEQKGEWETLQAVYQKLLGVFPESKKLHKLLKEVRAKLHKASLAEKKEYFDTAQAKIKELTKEGKLDDALQACYEIRSYDPGNKTFIKLNKQVDRKFEKQIDKDLAVYLDRVIPELKAEYKKDKKTFIRV